MKRFNIAMNNLLNGKKILLGITGGIAAYKICELVRLIRQAGAHVQIILTQHAKQFVTPLTLEVLSGRPVYSDLFEHHFESNIGHIQLARWADMIMVAPASADIIARLAHGLADDLLTTLCLASTVPLAIVPAMNMYMWQHPATQENVNCLINRGTHFIGPDLGEQACGDNGMGRLVQPIELMTWLENFYLNSSPSVFLGKKILITAGPTHEAIDPVRYIATLSSGSMGYSIAEVFAKLGAQVVLISGPSTLSPPSQVKKIAVTSAEEMHQAVMENLPCDIFVGAAAVADYKPELTSPVKIKRDSDLFSLKMIKNPDILATVQKSHPQPLTVGFAAETDNHLQNAMAKLHKKAVHMIVLNAVENGQGFGINQKNSVTFLSHDGQRVDLPVLSKSAIALRLVEFISDFYRNAILT